RNRKLASLKIRLAAELFVRGWGGFMRYLVECRRQFSALAVAGAFLLALSISVAAQQSDVTTAPATTNVTANAGASLAALSRSPFKALGGSWRGKGLIKLETGKSEQIGCKAYYRVKQAGNRLGMSIICASKSNKINLKAELDAVGAGNITGTWEERTFNATGTAVGQSSETSMRLKIDGTLQGTVSVILDGKSQQVSIYSSNAGLNGVTIRLQRLRS
ncbi:MAG: hypothetical protein AAFO75_10555, partial [Pseudomonadota bacterium]